MKSITSRDNPVFKEIAKLAASSAERKRRGLSVIEGPHLLAAYLEGIGKPDDVLATKAGLEDAEIAALVERSSPARVTVVSEALMDALSGVQSPPGIVASVKTPPARKVPTTAPLVLLIENIQDPGNVGTLLRSAAAAGAGHVLLSPTCAFAWSPKVLRAAMGAHFALNLVEEADLEAFVGAYRGTVIALTLDGESSIHELDLRGPTALLIGNEGAGLSDAMKALATVQARIPMPGPIESLNAGVAGSIGLFEAVRQRGRP
jgi:RNA methyltransferase, TrmH family